MDKKIVLSPDRTHILVKKNNALPTLDDSFNGENIGKYTYKDDIYDLYINPTNDAPFNHKFTSITEFKEFDFPFVVYSKNIFIPSIKKNRITFLQSISNIILIIIIMILIIYLIKYVKENYNFNLIHKT